MDLAVSGSVCRENLGIEEFWDYTPKDPLAALKGKLGASLQQGLAGAIGANGEAGYLSMQWGQ